jgi:D-alanyl-D-alanine carboxypeptidase
MKWTTTFFFLLFATLILAQKPADFEGFLNVDLRLEEGKVVQPGSVEDFPASSAGSVDPDLADSLQNILQLYYDVLGVAGLSASVIVEGEQWTGVVGRNTATEPVNDELKFAIGSVTKTLVAACILDMVENGDLGLEDQVGQYLPPITHVNPQSTIRQLLQHTSGIFNCTNHPNFGPAVNSDLNRIWTPMEVLSTFMNPPYFAPGQGWQYSNTNYILLGLIIEEVTGKAFHVEMRDRILDPLGLTSITLYPNEVNRDGLAQVWVDATGTGAPPVDWYTEGFTLDAIFSAAWAAGSYLAKPSEISEFMRAFISGEIVSPDLIEEAQISIDFQIGQGYTGYGLGLFSLETGCSPDPAWGHGGDIIYSSQAYHYPEDEITVAIHCNDNAVNSNDLLTLVDALHCEVIFYNMAVSVSDEDRLNELSVFPNPVIRGQAITLDLNQQNGLLEVLDVTGKVVRRQKMEEGENAIFLETPGLYGLKLIKEGNLIGTSKVVVH